MSLPKVKLLGDHPAGRYKAGDIASIIHRQVKRTKVNPKLFVVVSLPRQKVVFNDRVLADGPFTIYDMKQVEFL